MNEIKRNELLKKSSSLGEIIRAINRELKECDQEKKEMLVEEKSRLEDELKEVVDKLILCISSRN